MKRSDFMVNLLLEEAERDVISAYENNLPNKIAKETDYLLLKIVQLFQTEFEEKVNSINLKINESIYSSEYLNSSEGQKESIAWIKKLKRASLVNTELEFGKLKIDFEEWYYKIGGTYIQFNYNQDYLITVQKAAELLNVSKVTFNKYVSRGFEVVDTTKHNKVPQFMVEIWKNSPEYALKVQVSYQNKALSYTSHEVRLKEIALELHELEQKYNTIDLAETFKGGSDSVESTIDYFDWVDLIEEKEKLEHLLGGK